MRKVIILITGMAAVCCLSGCVSTETKTETKTLPDGTKIVTETIKSTNSVLEKKTVVTAGSTSAVKLESSGSTSSGTITPNFLVGSGTGSVATCPQKNNKVAIGMSWSAGILSSLFNASSSSGSFTYIGNDGETAEDTATRLKAVVNLKQAITDSNESGKIDTGETDSGISSTN